MLRVSEAVDAEDPALLRSEAPEDEYAMKVKFGDEDEAEEENYDQMEELASRVLGVPSEKDDVGSSITNRMSASSKTVVASL